MKEPLFKDLTSGVFPFESAYGCYILDLDPGRWSPLQFVGQETLGFYERTGKIARRILNQPGTNKAHCALYLQKNAVSLFRSQQEFDRLFVPYLVDTVNPERSGYILEALTETEEKLGRTLPPQLFKQLGQELDARIQKYWDSTNFRERKIQVVQYPDENSIVLSSPGCGHKLVLDTRWSDKQLLGRLLCGIGSYEDRE